MLVVDMKLFGRCARVECPCAHAAELEWSTDDLTTSSQQLWIDVDSVEVRSPIDEVINTGRRLGPAMMYVRSVGCGHRTIIGCGELFAAARNYRSGHDDEPTFSQLSGRIRRQMRFRCNHGMPVTHRHYDVFRLTLYIWFRI